MDHQQHHDREGDEEHGNNCGVHFWGDTDTEDEDDGLSCGLPEVDDWPNDHYTPCQEARLSNTITHAMRFIMVKDDNELCAIEDDTQERRRRRTVLNLAEVNRVADLCNEIKRHGKAIRLERTLHEELFSKVELRKGTGRGNYAYIRDKAEHVRKAREIFTSNSFEDIRWRQKFCDAKELASFTRSRGIRTLTTPPPPPTPPAPELPKDQTANTSSGSGTSFTILGSWAEDQNNEEARRDTPRPINIVAPTPRADAATQNDSQTGSDNAATFLIL